MIQFLHILTCIMEVSEFLSLSQDCILEIGAHQFSIIDKTIKYINQQLKDLRYNLQQKLLNNFIQF